MVHNEQCRKIYLQYGTSNVLMYISNQTLELLVKRTLTLCEENSKDGVVIIYVTCNINSSNPAIRRFALTSLIQSKIEGITEFYQKTWELCVPRFNILWHIAFRSFAEFSQVCTNEMTEKYTQEEDNDTISKTDDEFLQYPNFLLAIVRSMMHYPQCLPMYT